MTKKTTTADQSTIDAATARATETLDTNPLGVLAGGLALGAIAGALLPRTDREKELMRPVGAKLGATPAKSVPRLNKLSALTNSVRVPKR